MMIVLGAVSMEIDGRIKIFNSRLMLLLGNASYSLYLIHGLTFFGISNLLLYKFRMQDQIGPDGAVILYLIICCGIAIIVHKLIEKPLMHFTGNLMNFFIDLLKKF